MRVSSRKVLKPATAWRVAGADRDTLLGVGLDYSESARFVSARRRAISASIPRNMRG